MLQVEEKQLAELREKAAVFNRAWVARGRKLTAWTCPDCTARIEVRRPRRVDVGEKGFWDSLTTCTSCGRIQFVVTFPSGTTTVQRTRLARAEPILAGVAPQPGREEEPVRAAD